MTKKLVKGLLLALTSSIVLGGCAMFGDGIPEEQKGNYALIVSNTGERGENMDKVTREQAMYHTRASVGWVNGKPQFPARTSLISSPVSMNLVLDWVAATLQLVVQVLGFHWLLRPACDIHYPLKASS